MSALRSARYRAVRPLISILTVAALAFTVAPVHATDSVAQAPRPPVYPLQASANGRYLIDQNGTPFLMVGDSPQAMIGDISEADADLFFSDRQAAGFNTEWINLLCDKYTACRADGSTYDGIAPFSTPGDLSTPNEAYFAKVDHVLQLAANHGQVVLLDPIETGGWTSVATQNGTTKAYNYGRYLGQRYANTPNIIWMSGNDFQTWRSESDDAAIHAVAQGIKDADPHHLQTIELDYQRSGSLDDASWTTLLGLDAAYTYFPTYDQVQKEYNRATMPVFMVEGNYEGEHNAADLGTPQILRRQEYWTLLSGATGQLYGNRYTWQFIDQWKSNMDTTGSNQMRYVTALFAPRAWYNLIPDQQHTFVTAGYGTYADSGSLGANDYATAARTADGTLGLVYLPTTRTITVDLSVFSHPVNASWYDPTRGTYAPISGSPFANAGTQNFAPPGVNSDGDGDWALVLETDGQLPPSVSTLNSPTPNATGSTASAVTPPADGPRFIQSSNAVPQSPQASVTISYSQPQGAGDANVLAIGWNDSTSSIASVVDSAGNPYKVAAPTSHGDGVSQSIYYAPGIKGGQNTVTVTFDAPVPFADIRIAEYAHLDLMNPFDVAASGSGDGATGSSGTVSTNFGHELIVGAGMTTGAFTASAGQFTVRALTVPDGDILIDSTTEDSGTVSAVAPVNGSWVMQVATFH